MTRHVRTGVTCDYEGCKECEVDEGTEARQYAKSLGWLVAVRRNGRTVDLCPAHKGGAR